MKILLKMLIILALSLLLLIPKLMIGNLIDERESTSQKAKNEIAKKWGNAQCIAGPYIYIPAKYDNQKKEKVADDLIIFPDSFEIDGTVNSQILHRGIYDVAVYSAPFNIKGNFTSPKYLENYNLEKKYLTNKAEYRFFIRDLRGLNEQIELITPQNREILLKSSKNNYGYLSCPANIDGILNNDTIPYSLKLQLKGSQGLYILPCGNTSIAHIKSNSNSPSFTGFLPNNRQINDNGFTADWQVIDLNRSFSQTLFSGTFEDEVLGQSKYRYTRLDSDDTDEMDEYMGFSVKTGINQYQQNTRANKYAFLIIILTFITVLFVEIYKETPVHLIQYLLVGIALVLFYSLLLSFSEFMAFGWSYLIAAIMTIALITVYMAAILKLKKTALLIGGLMSVLYIYIFILLSMETLSLLAGSIGLFIILAIIMMASQKINWYK